MIGRVSSDPSVVVIAPRAQYFFGNPGYAADMMEERNDAAFLKKKAQVAIDDHAVKTMIIELQPAPEESQKEVHRRSPV